MNIPSYLPGYSLETYNQLLNTVLIQGLSNVGWTVPNLSYAAIVQVGEGMPLGTIWYDTDANKLVVKTASGYEAVTSVLI